MEPIGDDGLPWLREMLQRYKGGEVIRDLCSGYWNCEEFEKWTRESQPMAMTGFMFYGKCLAKQKTSEKYRRRM